jgi:transketolase
VRDAFAAEITELASRDERIVLLSGDIGNRLFDRYKQQHPRRFVNCGVAEANMISMAAGMALSGLRPIGYTITPFITTRCLEQIRVDVCYHEAPVIIVGVGAGLSYASLGGTHQSCEDIAHLRVLPNMTVVCPGDAVEVRQALRAAVAYDRPVYIRLGKKGEPVVHQRIPDFAIGKGIVLRTGDAVCILSTGTMLPVAVEAAQRLAADGLSTQLVSLHTVKPIDEELLTEAAATFRVIVTVEEHSAMGGLGGAVAEWLTDRPQSKARLIRVGTSDTFLHGGGGQDWARGQFGLTADTIVERTLQALKTTVTC